MYANLAAGVSHVYLGPAKRFPKWESGNHPEGWQNGECTSLENWREQSHAGSNPAPSAFPAQPGILTLRVLSAAARSGGFHACLLEGGNPEYPGVLARRAAALRIRHFYDETCSCPLPVEILRSTQD